MIAVYLLPYPVRGVRAPYLWVFYKWLSSLSERALFIVGEDYLVSPDVYSDQKRWELDPTTLRVYDYAKPAPEHFERHAIFTLPEAIFPELLASCENNPIALFHQMLTVRLPILEQAIDAAVAAAVATEGIPEAIVTWCNCPSLSAVAAARGIPVIHLEAGPLRAPLYRPTAYLDFSGVNGNTEAEQRFLKAVPPDRYLSPELLRRFFFLPELPPKADTTCVGLALQVEDDSNLVAFGRGFDNQAAIVFARLAYAGTQTPLAVRGHPGSQFKPKGDWFETDASYDSLAFIQRCRHIVTINSSLGLEAILLGTSVTLLGNSSFDFILNAQTEPERVTRLAFYLFAYLIPQDLQFDLDYLRFRLSSPSEAAIVLRHIRSYLGENGQLQDWPSLWALIESAIQPR